MLAAFGRDRNNRAVLGFATKSGKTLSPPRPETQRTRSSRRSAFANGKRNLQHKLWGQRSAEECPFIPVLQGYEKEDYLRCIDMYGEAGVDLSQVPLVGVGTVCRRQHTEAIGDVVEAILDTDPGLPLHLFGVKTLGLKLYGHKAASVDSLGWSYNARRSPKLPECQHASCNNCMKWALRWRRNIVGGAWCSRHGEWCAGFGGGYCGDFVAREIGGADMSAWPCPEPDRLAG